jgi:AmmeMemoRadiSam system protein A
LTNNLLTDQQKHKLLHLARSTIKEYISKGRIAQPEEDDPLLNKPMGAFVTLHVNGELKGCIGNITASSALFITIRDMAIAAASEDARFTPLSEEELAQAKIEISVLSPLKKVSSPDEIVIGKHGVLVRNAQTSGVYLPQVATETGWSKEDFMDSLCGSKAGMDPRSWQNGGCEIYIFSAEVFGE